MDSSGVAIIAMTGRFPGAQTLDQFWINLCGGVDSISRFAVPESHGDAHSAAPGPVLVRAAGMLHDIECFDHHFFDYSPADAELIDPQQRIFLEQAHACLEAAGYDPERYPGLIGVYAGISTNHYLCNNIYRAERRPDSTRQFHIMVANDKDYLATRVSYKLNLKGPSYSIQTACSTSLVAVHVACQSLLTGECDIALAGGVTVRVPQAAGYLYEEGMVYARDGRVCSFDAAASGTVIGSGVGIVALKLLDAALRDRDTVLAVIKGSATNNDGSFKASYAAPSKEGQARVILDAQALAAVSPASISYIEAHATGTLLGDPVELAALTQAFREHTAGTGFCAIGSVKSNIGHLDSAAGVAGLIKTVLLLKHRQLVPTVHYATPNPHIDFNSTPFYVSDRLVPWETQSLPRRAGVSSFGVGGTNAHLIVEEAPAALPGTPSDRWQLLVLSARTTAALSQMAANLDDFLGQAPSPDLADVAYTLAVGRRQFRYRRAIVGRHASPAKLTQDCVLDASAEVPAVTPLLVLAIPRLLPAAAYLSRAGACCSRHAQFREFMQQCSQALGRPLNFAAAPSASEARVLAFAALYSFARWSMTWGVEPQTAVGQGLGARVAEVVNGTSSLPQAMQWIDQLSDEEAAACDAMPPPPLAEQPAQVPVVLLGVGGREDLHAWPQHGLVPLFADDQHAADVQPALAMAQLWLAGVDIEWPCYYSAEVRNRVALPAYPFARHRHWIEPPEDDAATGAGAVLHPLVHRNVSSLEQCRFAARFTGNEFFLRDHVVLGRRTLPGAAYLEMVRAAAALACGSTADASARLVLQNVVWMSPITVQDAACEVEIVLRRGAVEQLIEYTVHSRSGDSLREAQLHSQGMVQMQPASQPAPLDMAAIRAATADRCIDQQAVYQHFEQQGLSYGTAHRGVQRIHLGSSAALAQLALPEEVAASAAQFCLHPSIMDAALQASAVLAGAAELGLPGGQLALPFELAQIEIHGSCAAAGFAYVRSGGSTDGNARSRWFDIDVCDEQGRICVRMQRLCSRSSAQVMALDAYRGGGLHRYVPAWNALPALQPDAGAAARPSNVVVIGAAAAQRWQIAEVYDAVRFVTLATDEPVESIAQQLAADQFQHLLWIAPPSLAVTAGDDTLLEAQRLGVVALFRLIKALLQLGYASRELAFTLVTRNVFAVLPGDCVQPAHAGVHGLAGSLAEEYEHWKIRLFDLDDGTHWPWARLFQSSDHASGSLALRHGEWFSRQLLPAQSLPDGQADFREGGVCVVLGGAGGIGEIFSRHLAERHRAQLVWIGRRELDDDIRRKIDRFPQGVPRPLYFAADATDLQALAAVRQRIEQAVGPIHAVVHSTITLVDRSLARMQEHELLAALAAKVAVSVCMAQAFAADALDFVLFFSSIQSFTRSAGQGNYAAGCVFADAFAQRLRQDWPCAVKTMSWGYWGAQGVVASAEHEERMAKAGIGSILPEEGMAALADLMGSSIDELVLFKGSRTDVLKVACSDTAYSAYRAEVPSVINALRQQAAPAN